MGLQKKAAKAKPERSNAELQRLQAENAHLRRAVDLQSKQLEATGKKRWKLPTAGKGPKSNQPAFVRLCVPDTHGCHIEPDAVGAMFRDLESLDVREVILLGDHLDCGGFLAQHHTLGYVSQTSYTFAEDVDAANQFLDRLQALTPNARFYFLQGNHELRLESWAVTQALRNGQDAQLLLDLVCASKQLHLDKRRIEYVRLADHWGDLRVRGTIRLGKCYFTHGKRHGVSATRKILDDYGACVVHAHTHTAASVTRTTVKEGGIGAWCDGCLCQLQPLYDRRDPTPWSHGYGLQIVRDNGDFLHIHVPIIDGVSYLVHLADELGRG